MIRPVATEIGLFLAPFILYAAFLVVTRTGVLQPKAWAPRRVAGLVIVSLVLMAGSFVVLAHFSGAPAQQFSVRKLSSAFMVSKRAA